MQNQFISPHPLCPSDSSNVPTIQRPQTTPPGMTSQLISNSLSSLQYNHQQQQAVSSYEISRSQYVHAPPPYPATQTPAHSYSEPGPYNSFHPPTFPSSIQPHSSGDYSSSEDASCPRCKELTGLVESLEKRVRALIVQIDKPISLNGTLIWNISEVSKIVKKSPDDFLESSIFYTASNGYKIQGCVYLNGDGEAKGKWMSVYITLLKGDFDGLLNWPFLFPVTIVLVDQSLQGLDVSKTFQPTRTSSCFRQPIDNIKRPSGLPDFFDLSKLKDPYLVDDTMYLKFIVHTTE